MAQCQDWPCCGHELGCCPDYDPETGEQLNMICTCGAKLPINNRSSLCDGCLRSGDDDEAFCDDDDEPSDMTDVEADADTLKSAGYGTNEDYGGYDSGYYD